MHIKLEEALSRMILSASGWRGVFAEDGDGESRTPDISPSHRVIASAAAKVFADYIKGLPEAMPVDSSRRKKRRYPVSVGIDTRPTGKAIADVVVRSLLGAGMEVHYTGVAAIPELIAYTRASGVGGFVYVSASHNPIGHNGLKFGLGDGGVLQAEENAKLVSSFRSLIAAPGCVEEAEALLARAKANDIAQLYDYENLYKRIAAIIYSSYTEEIISGIGNGPRREKLFSALRKGLEKRPLGIAADFNGSARAASIDREFFASLGIGFEAINETPGKIAHRIVPEGESLEPCRFFLEGLHSKDQSFCLGYACDCDGDRGNLVYYDEREKSAVALGAQETFALACMAELAFLAWKGELKYDESGNALIKAAIVVNDPTSLRIDRIAEAFGASVFRAEVGEANVVGLARRLREQGWLVRVLGEGSNGGTIIHPSAVRDPIDTIGSILKLLALKRRKEDLFRIWCIRSDQAESYREDYTLSDVIASLPFYATTGAATSDASLEIFSGDHGILKDGYQRVFEREWEERKGFCEEYGITGWEAIAYNGMAERRGIGSFGEAGRGGLKVEFTGRSKFSGKDKERTAFIWMRGSGTEPVFRVMADAESCGLERELIAWQRRMVLEAAASIKADAVSKEVSASKEAGAVSKGV